MQTILGANGQIGEELARELYRNYTKDLRLVSRNPKEIHTSDELISADLMDAEATQAAVKGSEIVYITAGLPMDTELWEAQYVQMIKNALDACLKAETKLVFFDNTYMYPKTAEPQTEATAFTPKGRKSEIRAEVTEMILEEMEKQRIEILICRAPEFYGPDKTKSISHTFVFDKIKEGKEPKAIVRDDVKRTLIWTPDASRAMALLGNTPDTYGQSWHLPCDDNRLTYKEIIDLAGEILGRNLKQSIISKQEFEEESIRYKHTEELLELLPRYEVDNLFLSDKFKKRFPEFRVTTYEEGIRKILTE